MPTYAATGFVLVILSAAAAGADDFPVVEDTEKSSPALTPQQALEALSLPEGFRATLFAAEPDVRQPIALATDSRGRLWVAENYSYAERERNFDDRFRDRILILEDTDQDGTFDRRTVFWDQGRRLTSVEIGYGGVWVLDAPRLLFIPDRDHNDQPDGEPIVMLDGWNDSRVRHNIVNGLRWGPDGWLYGRHGILATSTVGPPGSSPDQRIRMNCGIWRFHPVRHTFEVVCHGGTNSWGMDWDSNGEMFYINTVIGHLWHVVPGAYYRRMYGEHLRPNLYQVIEQTADHFHWDTTETWSDIRKLGVTKTTDEAGGGHAHSGMVIAQFPDWPEQYSQSVLTVNLHGRRLNRDTLHRHGATFTGRHAPDFIHTTDPWFRGVELHAGRHGELYIADWSDTGECHENDGVHRSSGRIFRITYRSTPQGATPPGDTARLRDLSSVELVDRLSANHEWQSRTVRRLLAERSAEGKDLSLSLARLLKQVRNGSPGTAIRALWTLHTLNAAREPVLVELLQHDREELRVAAVRMLSSHSTLAADTVKQLAGLSFSESSGLVLTHLASLLRTLPHEQRWALAEGLASQKRYREDRVLPLMIWYGIEPAVPGHPAAAIQLVNSTEISSLRRFIARRITGNIERNPEAVEQLLRLVKVTEPDTDLGSDLVQGMSMALRGWRKAPRPAGWNRFASLLSSHPSTGIQQQIRELSVVFGDGRALDLIEKIAFGNASVSERRAAIRTLVRARRAGLVGKLQNLLGNRDLAAEAIYGLAAFNTPETPELLVARFSGFRSAARAEAVNTLVSRPLYAQALLEAIQGGRIPRDAVSAFQIRQMQSFENASIGRQVSDIWPDLKQQSARATRQIRQLQKTLTDDVLSAADRSRGRALFAKSCANCHKLFGEGRSIGPDLTGAQRSNLNYLLENIVDPSATVSKNFQLTSVVLENGRVFNGVVLNRSEKILTLQTADRRVTIPVTDIDETRDSQLSLMPENQLRVMTDQEIQDLISYLMSPGQVPLPEKAAAGERQPASDQRPAR